MINLVYMDINVMYKLKGKLEGGKLCEALRLDLSATEKLAQIAGVNRHCLKLCPVNG